MNTLISCSGRPSMTAFRHAAIMIGAVALLSACDDKAPAPTPGPAAGQPVVAAPGATAPAATPAATEAPAAAGAAAPASAAASPAPGVKPPATAKPPVAASKPAVVAGAAPKPAVATKPAKPVAKARTPEADRKPTDLQAGDLIRTPATGGPAWAIQEVLAAASETDEEVGWKRFENVLHSSQKIARALEARRKLNYPAARRKVSHFIKKMDPGPVFKVSRIVKEPHGRLRLFIENTKGMPTPCVVAPDKEAKGAWRVETCSL